MTRNRLPDRRPSESFCFTHGQIHGVVTVGYRLPELEPAEIFIRCGKAGTGIESEARDAAIVCSIALQHGATLADVEHSLTKTEDGRPASILGAALQAVRMP